MEKDFYVACVSYDGFDETEDTVFPGMLEETEKIESYIRGNFDGELECAYGCSLGGSFVGLLIQRKNIHINHGILGSSDLDQMSRLPAYIFCKIGAAIFYKMFQKGKLPGVVQKKRITQAKTDPYIREGNYDSFFGDSIGFSLRTVHEKGTEYQKGLKNRKGQTLN